ncbi:MAG: ABC transporter permease [Clostridia bacterium]|nr:ABC transporter permease [Clostridia bacterium]
MDISAYKKKSQLKEIWRRFQKNRAAMIGLAVFSLVCLLLIFADVIVDYQTMAIDQNIGARLQSPGPGHILGTDDKGRDMFARILHGGRRSVGIAMLISISSCSIGLLLGGISGYFGGRVDNWMMRILDVIMCIPGMLLTLALIAALGKGIDKLMIALIIGAVPSFTRIVRSVVLKCVGNEYIEAAKANGASHLRIILKYVLPNSIGPLISSMTLSVSGNILSIASMSFIGLGIVPPTPEWGSMLSEAKEFMRYYPYLCIIPGVAILITSLSISLMGDGLRDALDPRLKD